MNQGGGGGGAGGGSIKMSSTAVKGQMKGLLKGLRYISQIFDEDEEKEIQIGFPTDVKHLAHIGCEDGKANPPSWMTEFKDSQPSSPKAKTSEGLDSGNNSDTNSSVRGDGKKSHARKSRHRSSDSQSSISSPTREEGSTKPSRRHHSSETSRRHSRHSTEEEDSNKPPTKHTHRRKTKTSEDKDKESSSTRKPRRSSKAGSLTDLSFTNLAPGPGPGSVSGPLA
ncbi:CRIB domain-containing protein RIC5-like [Vicia villosa]|uniref:CRIB domain-containing protein RIC5-like n=1 Tax=Vicia villosa TaxID=3911 RepID=UPI00273C1D56|nr:CRIB domain-containing protein RIC5-like [Vicia villosa]XP_058770763.1 CRIB domain-containing protein RIC5-like [Vicia villosa]